MQNDIKTIILKVPTAKSVNCIYIMMSDRNVSVDKSLLILIASSNMPR